MAPRKEKMLRTGNFAMSRTELVRRINALPDWARSYIQELETRSDPAGDVGTIADLREQVEALSIRVIELETKGRKPKTSR